MQCNLGYSGEIFPLFFCIMLPNVLVAPGVPCLGDGSTVVKKRKLIAHELRINFSP